MLEDKKSTIEYRLLYQRFRKVAPELGFRDDVVTSEVELESLFTLFRQGPPLSVVTTLTRLAEVTNQVCEIRNTNPASRLGTGFLVGPDLLLTASHVVDGVPLANLQCVFNNIVFGSGTVTNGGITRVGVTKTEDESKLAVGQAVTTAAFDFVLLRLDSVIGNATRKFITVATNAVTQNDSMYIVDFPGAQAVSFTAGTVSMPFNSTTQAAFRHNARTQPGSSGAPVFDNQFKLAGLHRGNVNGANDNEAVDISRVFTHARAKGFF